MEPRLRRLDPRLLARLAEDIPSVAVRLIQLRTLFPGADVLSLVDHRRVPSNPKPQALDGGRRGLLPAPRSRTLRTGPAGLCGKGVDGS